MGKLTIVISALVCLLVAVARQSLCDSEVFPDRAADRSTDDEEANDVELESERQLKRMLAIVSPLMAIVRKADGVEKRSVQSDRRYDLVDDDWRNSPSAKNGYGGYGGGGYGGGGYGGGGYGGGSYGYGSYCCQKKDDLLPLLALLGLAGLLLYLIAIASKTTTAAGRRKRSDHEDSLNDLTDEIGSTEIKSSFPQLSSIDQERCRLF